MTSFGVMKGRADRRTPRRWATRSKTESNSDLQTIVHCGTKCYSSAPREHQTDRTSSQNPASAPKRLSLAMLLGLCATKLRNGCPLANGTAQKKSRFSGGSTRSPRACGLDGKLARRGNVNDLLLRWFLQRHWDYQCTCQSAEPLAAGVVRFRPATSAGTLHLHFQIRFPD